MKDFPLLQGPIRVPSAKLRDNRATGFRGVQRIGRPLGPRSGTALAGALPPGDQRVGGSSMRSICGKLSSSMLRMGASMRNGPWAIGSSRATVRAGEEGGPFWRASAHPTPTDQRVLEARTTGQTVADLHRANLRRRSNAAWRRTAAL